MLDRLRGATLLDGVRGAPRVDGGLSPRFSWPSNGSARSSLRSRMSTPGTKGGAPSHHTLPPCRYATTPDYCSVGRVDESRITRTGGESGDGDTGPARSAHESRDAKPEPGQGPIEELAGRPACPRRLAAAIGCHPGDSAARPLFEFFVDPLDLVLSYRYTTRSNAVVGPSFASPAPGCWDARIRGAFWSFFHQGGRGVSPVPRACRQAQRFFVVATLPGGLGARRAFHAAKPRRPIQSIRGRRDPMRSPRALSAGAPISFCRSNGGEAASRREL